MKNNNKNEINNFINGLLELGKDLENQLKEYSNTDLFKGLFPNLTKEIDNSIKNIDEISKKNINVCDKEIKNINKLDNSHIEMKEDEEKYEYIFKESFKRPYVDIIAILKKKLEDFTFAACTDNKEYVLSFTFGNVHYNFNWDKSILHFVGSTDDDEFEIECEPFYFDEVDNSFKEINEKDADNESKKTCNDEEQCEDKCCEVKCSDECCKVESSDECCISEKKEDLGKWDANILFEEINKEADRQIEEELLPIIKTGVDKVLSYKLYKIERSSNSKYFDIVVFSLEDVQLNCKEFIRKFWDIISYERLVKFFVDTYGFKKVFILEKEENTETIHEVRCFLK